MEFKYFSQNGMVQPIREAHVRLSNIEYQYGFGVYESVRVAKKTAHFLNDHIERLMESAQIIGLEHSFTPEVITKSIDDLLAVNDVDACNIKIVLIGPNIPLRGGGEATLNILCLNPLFPDKKLYRDGVHTVTYEYERAFPHAKTLNMLQSYLAYSKAKAVGAYDALLLDREGNITEGTRTNFFAIKGKTLFSPPEERILLGVTRKHVLGVARENGYLVEEQSIGPNDLSKYDGAFLTSTSSKIMPIRSVDSFEFGEQSVALKELMTAFDDSLKALD